MMARITPTPNKLYPMSLSSPKIIPAIVDEKERPASVVNSFFFVPTKKTSITIMISINIEISI